MGQWLAALTHVAGSELDLSIGRVEIPPRLALSDFHVHCSGWVLNGDDAACRQFEIRQPWLGLLRGRLRVGSSGEHTEIAFTDIAWAGARGRIVWRWSRGHWTLRCTLSGIDLSQLARLHGRWITEPSGYTDIQGSADVRFELGGAGKEAARFQAVIGVRTVGFNGPDAAQDLAAKMELRAAARPRKHWVASSRLEFTRGQLYLEPGFTLDGARPGFALETPGLVLRINAEWDPSAGKLDVFDLVLDHKKTLRLRASGSFRPFTSKPWDALRLNASLLDLRKAYPMYLQPLLIGTVLRDIKPAGRLGIDARITAGVLAQLRLVFSEVSAREAQGGFEIRSLSGQLPLLAHGQRLRSRLRFAQLKLQRLAFGPVDLDIESQEGELRLARPVGIPVLDGKLWIESLRAYDFGDDEFSLQADTKVEPFSLARFTRALGWHPFSGRFSGVAPGIDYRHDTLRVGGALRAQVFDGVVVVQNLYINDPFGPVPVLTADISVRDLDLEALTGTFSFGKIEGGLGGRVRGLRLEDGQPLAFDAEFSTPAKDPKPHRISQRAVDSLTSLGGGGSANTFSRALLGLFDTFSYARLGITCRLRNGVCAMGGVGPVEDGGYYIVKRGKVPPVIDVKGYNLSVAWRTLIDRLKRVTASKGAVVK